MPRGELVADQGGRGGQGDRALRDPAAGVRRDRQPQGVQCGLIGLRTDDDALAAGPVDRLEHERMQIVQHVFEYLPVVQAVAVHVGDDGILAQVVPDEVGHVRIEQLVVGDAVADPVGQLAVR